MSEISKAYEPQAVEEKWYSRWIADGCFAADPASAKPAYSIVIPPPNVTGMLTLGHVLNNSIQDVLARRARMLGREVLWLPGTDHAGIATQTVVERKLRKEEGKTRRDLGREAFLERVQEWKEKHGGIIIQQLKKLGCSCDWARERFTMDAAYSHEVQAVFVALYKKGLIYRGKRMVNWCPVSLTALSDEEVIMKPQNGWLYHMRYELAERPGEFLEIATTRPETLMGDTAVAVHPHDERYRHLIGSHVWRPFPRAKIPIVADEHIDPKFGTGVLKVTPAHDKADFEIGLRHGLEVIDVLHPDATMNELAGPDFAGLDRFAARKLAVEKLRELGLLVKEEPYQNSVGYSERADVPIEPRLSEQWFLKYPKVEEALAAVHSDDPAQKITFRPERWAHVFDHWMRNIQDWCISRQLWWGHRIPVWYFHWNGPMATEPSDSQNVRLDLPFLSKEQNQHVHPQVVRPGNKSGEIFIAFAVDPGYADIEKLLNQHGGQQDTDVLDTWFSSWLWPFGTMTDDGSEELASNTPGQVRTNSATLAKFYPTTDLVTGPDIIFFWVARMMMAGYEFTGQRPFANVFYTGLIRDLQGRKMSKSLGNSPDPLDLIAKYGADGIRLGLLRIAPQGQDIRFDEKQIEEGRNFANKLWNAARFRQMHGPSTPEVDLASLPALSIYSLDILAKLQKLVAGLDAAYAEYRFNEAAQLMFSFFWSDYCDAYVEAAKSEIFSEDPAAKASALAVMDFVLSNFLRLLQPFMPHLTAELWETMGFASANHRLGGNSSVADEKPSYLMFAAWPDAATLLAGIAPEALSAAAEKVKAVYEAVHLARNLRAEVRIPSNKKVRFFLKPVASAASGAATEASGTKDTADWAQNELPTLARLANAESVALDPAYAPAQGEPRALTPLGELYLPLEGLVDVAAEKERIAKEIAKVLAELTTVQKKLTNENFVNNAPPAVVEEHRRREADWREKLAQLKKMEQSFR